MVINPHDLLKIRHTDLTMCTTIPDWVTESLQAAPYVVVRRAPIIDGMIPIGVRGNQRNQRFGAYIAQKDIIEHIPPNQVISGEEWRQKIQESPMPALQALERVHDLFQSFNLLWGPAGSVGFEIASDSHVVTKSSDLDVIVYSEEVFPIEKAKNMTSKLKEIPVRVDVQVETPKGAISLLEYARNEFPVLIKTKKGPDLVNNPWEKESVNATERK